MVTSESGSQVAPCKQSVRTLYYCSLLYMHTHCCQDTRTMNYPAGGPLQTLASEINCNLESYYLLSDLEWMSMIGNCRMFLVGYGSTKVIRCLLPSQCPTYMYISRLDASILQWYSSNVWKHVEIIICHHLNQ